MKLGNLFHNKEVFKRMELKPIRVGLVFDNFNMVLIEFPVLIVTCLVVK